MKIYKNFTRYTPENGVDGAMYLQDEDGNDWYKLQSEFSADAMKIAYDSTGLLVDAKYDVSGIVPLNLSVAETDKSDLPEGFPGDSTSRWQFDGKTISEKPLTAEEYQARAEEQRQTLVTEANSTTADWRTELQLDVISDDDKASLVKWMAYIKALKALDLTGVTNEAGYKSIAWPDKPE
ncbi:tail fiber assembly protein [Pantoea sp. BAV 3049]|uniref:tail fiber assembly protein n=1 Tax=Pantoea sp. BAV 3049 TaxID=2654188 RepID=UPI00131B305A|nr:tail fiber assembly protein [Pantoea sp. BAV 3049]